MTTAQVANVDQLPYGGTWREYQSDAAARAVAAEATYTRLIGPAEDGRPHTADETDAAWTAARGAMDAWSVAALLEFIRHNYGETAAYTAAGIAQDMGFDGDQLLREQLTGTVRPLVQPGELVGLLPLVRALVGAQRAMLDRYASGDNNVRIALWTSLHETGNALGSRLDHLTVAGSAGVLDAEIAAAAAGAVLNG